MPPAQAFVTALTKVITVPARRELLRNHASRVCEVTSLSRLQSTLERDIDTVFPKEPDMLRRSAPLPLIRIGQQRAQLRPTTPGSKWWVCCQTEVRGHVAVLEQATMAVFEGYLSDPLYHRAVHAVQRLLTLAETVAWREGTRVAHEIAHLFQPDAAFGLVHALQLSELLAALYREMAPAAAGQPPARRREAGTGDPSVPPTAVADVVAGETGSMARVTLACASE